MPRSAAIAALVAIDTRDAYSNVALDRALRSARLTRRDAALATELVYGVLKHRVWLDHVLDRWLRRPIRTTAAPGRAALRIGAYQLLVLDRVPTHAAIDETVEAAKRRSRRLAGLVNAVLRRVADTRTAVLAERTETVSDPQRLGRRYGLPKSIAVSLITRFGLDGAIAYGAAIQRPAPLTLRIRRLECREAIEAALLESGCEASTTPYSPAGLHVRGGGRPDELAPVADGHAVIQDEASQLVALLCDPESQDRVLDLCAGRGGKTVHLADCRDDAGTIVACDASARKLDILDRTAKRLGLRSVRSRRDGDDLRREAPFDVVLVDAPCTGSGNFRRHPELRWKWSASRLARLQATQQALLDRAAPLVAPGGRLIYSVCSDLPSEGDEAVVGFLSKWPDFQRDQLPHNLDWTPLTTAAGDLQLHPHTHDTDGFFAARLRRLVS